MSSAGHLSGAGPASAVEAPVITPEPHRYERIGVLGEGGMGRVYVAFDRRLGREVALKEVLVEAPDTEARLLREATLCATLDHPGIVPVYDVARGAEGRLFYTMRLVRGARLSDVLERMPPTERVRLVRHLADVARALAFAHARGVVHRDVKPDNVLVGPQGETQLADWGLARRLDEALVPELSASPTPATALTLPGVRLGTPRYAAPELAVSTATPRSDVYALGCALVEVLAGRATPSLTPAALPPETAPELAAIIKRCLAVDPLARYADAGALSVDLSAWLDGGLVGAHAYSATQLLWRAVKAWRAPLLVGAVTLVLGVAAVAWQAARTRTERDRAVVAEHDARTREQALLLQAAVRGLSSSDAPQAAAALSRASEVSVSPEVTGLAMALGGFVPPSLVEVSRGPACQRRLISETGVGWCLDDGVIRRRDGNDWARVGAETVRVASARGERLVVQAADGSLQTWSAAGREERFDGVQFSVAVGHAAGFAWARNPAIVVLASSARWERHTPCGVEMEIAATRETPDGLEVLCGDGARITLKPGVAPRVDSALRIDPPLLGIAGSAFVSPEVVVISTVDRRLTRVELRARTVKELLAPAPGRSVVDVVATPPLVTLRFVQGGAQLFDADDGALRATLPAWARGVVSPEAAGLRVTGLDGLESRWRFDGVSRGVVAAGQGITSLATDAQGTRAVFGGGRGLFGLWAPEADTLRTVDPGTRKTIKGVAWVPERELAVAGGVNLYGLAVDRRGGPLERFFAHSDLTMRAVGSFADGRLWALGYGGGPYVIDADGVPEGVPGDGPLPLLSDAQMWTEANSTASGDAVLLTRDDGAFGVFSRGQVVERGHVVVGALVAARTAESALVVADGATLQLPGVAPTRFEARVTSLRHHPTKPLLGVGLADGQLLLLDEHSGDVRARARLHDERVSAIAFSDAWLFTGSWDGTVRRWSLSALDGLDGTALSRTFSTAAP